VNRLRELARGRRAVAESEGPGLVAVAGVTLTATVALAIGAQFLNQSIVQSQPSVDAAAEPGFARTASNTLGPALEAERLRTLELAAIDSICAQVRRAGDAIGPICGLTSEQPPRLQSAAPARPRVEEAPRSRSTPPTPYLWQPHGAQVLIAPPGFGPDPNNPFNE
jgi:hypothetical protein